MYNGVLKYGSYIVDALVKYEQPIFVYIPPFGELRGGSWVVVDPTINSDQMEMYADTEARGGVLEPDGLIGIKYRRDRQLETMARLDVTYGDLKRQLADKALNAEQQASIKKKMTEREELLLPVYSQIAWQFADLHDRAGRMQAKETIRKPIEWKSSRRYFYWRLRRRLNEETILKKMASTGSKTTRAVHLANLVQWAHVDNFDEDVRAVAQWYEEKRGELYARIDAMKNDSVASEVASLLRGNKNGGLKGVKQILGMLSDDEKQEVLKYLASA